MLSDRLFAAVWLIVCGIIVWQMWHLQVPFSYEPVGPKAFPMLLSALMALCCLLLIIKPDRDLQWPAPAILIRGAALIATLLIYAGIFQPVGFAASTTFMVIAVSRLFGAGWRAGVLSGLAIGIVGYLVFDRLLQVSLPLGSLWG